MKYIWRNHRRNKCETRCKTCCSCSTCHRLVTVPPQKTSGDQNRWTDGDDDDGLGDGDDGSTCHKLVSAPPQKTSGDQNWFVQFHLDNHFLQDYRTYGLMISFLILVTRADLDTSSELFPATTFKQRF